MTDGDSSPPSVEHGGGLFTPINLQHICVGTVRNSDTLVNLHCIYRSEQEEIKKITYESVTLYFDG